MKSIKLSLFALITFFIGASLHAEESIDDPWFWDIPTLRFEYEQEVLALKAEGDQMESEGLSNKDIAIALHEKRRALGVKYKGMTPAPLR